MLLIPNRFATSCQVVDDAYFYEWLGNPFRMPKEQLPAIMFATPSGLPGRGHDCIGDMYGLILDYDSGYTMEQFAADHSDLKYFLYTTSSHTPEHHRFRVILDLEAPVPYAEVKEHRAALHEYFPQADPASWLNWMAVPAASSNYEWRTNPGEAYSFDRIRQIVAERPELLRRERPQASMWVRNCFGQKVQTKDPARYADAIWQECLEELWSLPRHHTGGRRHIPFFMVIRKLCESTANGQYLFTDDEIRSMIAAHTWDEKRRKMVESQLKLRSPR